MSEVRRAFLTVGTSARDHIAADAVAQRWSEPSALAEMTVGALAAHLARAVFTVDQYLSNPAPSAPATVRAPDYFWSLLSGDAYAGLDSELQVAVRSRADADAADGHTALVARLDETLERLTEALANGGGETVEVLGGSAMELDEYLRGRLVELVVHLDDLASSLGEEFADIDDVGGRIAVEVLAEISRRRHGTVALARALTRIERAPSEITAF